MRMEIASVSATRQIMLLASAHKLSLISVKRVRVYVHLAQCACNLRIIFVLWVSAMLAHYARKL